MASDRAAGEPQQISRSHFYSPVRKRLTLGVLNLTHSASKQVTEFLPLSLQVTLVMRIRPDFDRDLFDNFQAIAFKANDLFRVICQQPDGVQAEVNEDLRSKPVFAQVHAEAKL